MTSADTAADKKNEQTKTAPDEGEEEGVDVIQRAMGDIGCWQIVICIAVSLVKVTTAWHQLAIIFLAPPQEFWCAKPEEWSEANMSFWREVSKEVNQVGRGSCRRVNESMDHYLSNKGLSHVNTVKCDQWEFDHSIFSNTIVEEWLLICEREVLAQVAQMLYMLGILVGSFGFGIIADWYGRSRPLMVSILVQIVAGVGTAFADSFATFSILRFIDAVATSGAMVTSFVIVMEIVGRKWRTTASVLYQIPFGFGHMILPGLAYLFPDWRQYQLALSLPSILLVSYYWLVPESPRWLITMGKIDEAANIVRQAASRNGLPESQVNAMLAQLKVKQKEGVPEKKSFLDLIRHSKLRIYTICLAYEWLVGGVGYFGIAQYMGQVAGNIYINVAVGGILDVPGAIICIFAADKFGRRATLAASNLITGLACLSIIAGMRGDIQVALSAIGLVGASIAFPTLYLYSGEIFPTAVRNAGIGFVVMSARFGSMAAPFISGLEVHGQFLPPLVFGIFPLVGCVLCYLLPETLNTKLPDRIEEVDKFYNRKKIFGEINASYVRTEESTM